MCVCVCVYVCIFAEQHTLTPITWNGWHPVSWSGWPRLSRKKERSGNIRIVVGAHAISVAQPLLISITQGRGGGGGFHVKNNKPIISELRALATHTPIWGRVAQGALELFLRQIRKCHFF